MAGKTKTEIVLTYDGVLTKEEQDGLRYLLSDALHDFQQARAGDYVARRYAGHDEAFKERKAQDVAVRCLLAHRLHNASLCPEVRVTDPKEGT